ncbi:MAG: STAS domain-containing protein [Solirubrobacteraceae bacterium]
MFTCIASEWGAGAVLIQAVGELDLAGAPRLTRALRDALVETRIVVLDLTEVTFLDSAGVHALVNASVEARCDGRQLLLINIPDRAVRLFTLTGACDQLDVFAPGPAESSPRHLMPGLTAA